MTTYRFIAYILFIATGLMATSEHSRACTRVFYEAVNQDTKGEMLLVGRTLDWEEGLEAIGLDLYTLPSGLERVGSTQENPFKWTSKYKSLMSYIYGGMAAEGVNEKGLVGNILFLSESKYGQRLPSQPGLAISLWLQYIFDSFETVAEAVETLKSPPFHLLLVEAGESFKALSTVHLALNDRTGDCAVVEYVNGKPSVYHNRRFRVLTNSPPFKEQLVHLLAFTLADTGNLPGMTTSKARFIRAVYYLRRLAEKTTHEKAIAGLLSVMHNVAEPYTQTKNPSEPDVAPTRWISIFDQNNGRYYLELTDRFNRLFVDMKQLDFGKITALSLRVPKKEFLGDVSALFTPATLPPFVKELPDYPQVPVGESSVTPTA